MPDEKSPPPQIPLVPMAQHTLSANVALCSFGPAGFQLVLIDQRNAIVREPGDTPVMTNFEIGRFQLSPAAFRALQNTMLDAEKNFANINTIGLPTRDQMVARDQTSALERSLQQFKPPEEPKS